MIHMAITFKVQYDQSNGTNSMETASFTGKKI